MSVTPNREHLEQLKLTLMGMDSAYPTEMQKSVDKSLARMSVVPANLRKRVEGRDWPAIGLTMVGKKRLDNVQQCVERVLEDGVPGDLVETGVWRGGTAMLMRAVLKAHSVKDRLVFAADSFEGLPVPDADKFPVDAGCHLHEWEYLAVSLEEVKANFARFGLLDDQVRFVKGWFRDTMPALSGHPWAVIRLDGDMYESTMTVLENLYPDLSLGGYLIVDDYRIRRCRTAVEDYRRARGIQEEIEAVDWTGAYWRKRVEPDE
jgi:O-methyltransferase